MLCSVYVDNISNWDQQDAIEENLNHQVEPGGSEVQTCAQSAPAQTPSTDTQHRHDFLPNGLSEESRCDLTHSKLSSLPQMSINDGSNSAITPLIVFNTFEIKNSATINEFM